MEKEPNFIDPETLPIYLKAQEIFDVIFQITELFPEDNNDLQYIKGNLISDAAILSIKVVGAQCIDSYDLKMESATIIRKAAKELMIQNHTLEMFGFEDVDYYNIVKDLLEEYRLLFIDWVKGFDQWDYVIDRWGLFNPPGIGPFDHDPDDDIPYEDGFPFGE